MTTKDSRANDEAEIRTLIDDWANALRGKDADGVVARHGTSHPSMRVPGIAKCLKLNQR